MRIAPNKSPTAVPHEVLGTGLVSYSQYASEIFAVLYTPSWQRDQLMIVAATPGKKSRKLRRNELTARLDSAVSTLPVRDSFIGLRALTKPERMKNMATQAEPWLMSRKKGRWKSKGGPSSLPDGSMRCRQKARTIWLDTTKRAAMPRRPCHKR